MAGLDANEREIVSKLIESKAVDFEALGSVIGQVAPEAIFRLDGEDTFCGTMKRFVRLYRLSDIAVDVEELEQLREVAAEVRGAVAR